MSDASEVDDKSEAVELIEVSEVCELKLVGSFCEDRKIIEGNQWNGLNEHSEVCNSVRLLR